MIIQNVEQLRVRFNEPPGYFRLLCFAESVEQGKTPDPEILKELAAAFRKMLAEKNLKKRPAVFTEAMNLKGKKGKNPPTAREGEPRFEAALRVFMLDPDGKNQAWAVGEVALQIGVDDSTVRRYVRENKSSAQPFAKQILRMMEKRKDK